MQTLESQRQETVAVATTNGSLISKPDAQVKGARIWALLRIGMGFTFLWAFLDKTFALGFATGRNPETGVIDFFGPGAWINGASPTAGFLQFGVKGPFKGAFSALAGHAWVDWVYMGSLLLIGVMLLLGIGTRLAAIGGAIWMGLFYLASSIWPDNNPVLDEHIISILVLVGIAYVGVAGLHYGLGSRWGKTGLVKRFPLLA